MSRRGCNCCAECPTVSIKGSGWQEVSTGSLTEPVQVSPTYNGNWYTWQGDAKPNKRIRHAYLIRAHFLGQLTFTVEGVTIVVDSEQATVSVAGTSEGWAIASAARSAADPGGTVEIKVTPTHLYAAAWSYGGDQGLQVIDMSAIVLHRFTPEREITGNWTVTIGAVDEGVILSPVTVESRRVVYDGYPAALVVNCHESIGYPCAKKILDELAFDATFPWNYPEDAQGKMLTPNVNASGPALNLNESAGYEYSGSGWVPVNGVIQLDPIADQADIPWGASHPSTYACSFKATQGRWRRPVAGGNWSPVEDGPMMLGSFALYLPDPTPQDPYPVPVYRLRWEYTHGFLYADTVLTCKYASQADSPTQLDVPVDAISAGVTLTYTGAVTTYEEVELLGQCEDFNGWPEDPQAAFSADWSLF